MTTTQKMYWLTRLDYITNTLDLITIGLAIAFVGVGLVGVLELSCAKEHAREILRISAKLFCAAILSSIVRTFIPSTKEMAAIIVVPKIVNNEKVQETGNKLYDLAVEWLDALKPAKDTKEGK